MKYLEKPEKEFRHRERDIMPYVNGKSKGLFSAYTTVKVPTSRLRIEGGFGKVSC